MDCLVNMLIGASDCTVSQRLSLQGRLLGGLGAALRAPS